MALYGPSTATATVTANTNSVSVTGMDLSLITPGMTINLGARGRKTGDAFIISAVALNGSNGGTITTQESIPTAYNSAPFVIDTTGYQGTDASYAAAVGLAILSTLSTLLGVATNLYSGARQLVLDKVAAVSTSRIMFSIAGRSWGAVEHRTFPFTPTGGQAQSIETLALRAAPDGTTWTDALLFDLSNGTGDLRKGSATMASATTVDLGSAPMGKVSITGSASISSLGAGRHLERLVHIVDGGATLKHNATSLILPGGADIVTRAGDCFHATSDNAGNWRVRSYQRGDGTALRLGSTMTSYTPVVTAGSGAIGALGPCSARYQMLSDKICYVQFDIAISNNGSGASLIGVNLPFLSSDKHFPCFGREIAVTGQMLEGQSIPNSAQLQVFRYDNSYPGGSGARLILSLIYEVA